MHGRQILDGFLIANECIHSRHKEKILGLICKVNLEKAYYRFDWDFLSYLMREWVSVLSGADGSMSVSTTHFSILINDTSKGFFPAQRGIRQGDPLSPFLFAIVGVALSLLITVVAEANLITCFRLARTSSIVSHLQFVDDTILFYAAEENQVKNISTNLRCYKAILGLKVNLFKSTLIGISKDPYLIACLAEIMGVRSGVSFDFLPRAAITHYRVSKSLCDPIMERIKRKLAS